MNTNLSNLQLVKLVRLASEINTILKILTSGSAMVRQNLKALLVDAKEG